MSSHNTNSGEPEQDPFAALWNGGYKFIVPITPPDAQISEKSSIKEESRGKAPGVRGHSGWHSFDWLRHETTEEDLGRWQRMGAGVGIRTGLQHDGTYLIAVDADTLDPRCASIISHHIRSKFGFVPTRIGRAPKCLYLIRTSGPVPYTRIEFAHKERVELLGDGRQFVAAGIHPATREPYHWPQPLKPLSALPIVEPQELIDLLQALRLELPEATAIVQEGGGKIPPQESLRGDPRLVRAAIAALPNTSDAFPTRESYLAVGYAIKAALPDDQDLAYELWCQWAARWLGYVNAEGEHVYNTPQTIEKDWSGMKPPFKRGAHFLYELADKHGDGQFNMAALYFDVVNEEDENPFAVAAEAEQAERKSAKRYEFLSMAQAVEMARTVSNLPLVQGLIDQGTLVVTYGDSNSGKTFVKLEMAYCIATGRPFAGMKTTQGPVIYIAAEGGGGILKRLVALAKKYGDDLEKVPFRLLRTSVDLLDPAADTVPLTEAMLDLKKEMGGLSLVTLDTLARALGAGDENKSTDMGAFIQNVDRMRAALGSTFDAVHHTGKDAARGARGWSGLRAAIDTEIEIAPGVISVTKQRDLELGLTIGFTLESVELWKDDDGKPVTSATVRLLPREGGEPVGIPTEAEAECVEAFKTLQEMTDGKAGVSVQAVIDWLAARPGANGVTGQKVRGYVRALVGKRLVQRVGRGLYKALYVNPQTISEHFSEIPDEENMGASGEDLGDSVFD